MRSGKLDAAKLKETQRELDKRGDIFDEKTDRMVWKFTLEKSRGLK